MTEVEPRMATAGTPGLHDPFAIDDRAARVRTWSRRRAVRARLACVAVAVAAAWCSRMASAGALLAQASSEGQPLGAPLPAASGSATGEVVRLVGALVVVVGLALAAQWWVRRSGLAPRLQGGAFEVLARHGVGRGQHVLVARFGPRVLLVQQGRDGLRTLCELSDAADIDSVLVRMRPGAAAEVPAPPERTIDLRRGKGGAA